MLDHVQQFNDLSPEFLSALEEKVLAYGPVVRYRFDIGHKNPDPEKYDGETIWPALYTLDPARFNITDSGENRKDKKRFKQIALIESVDNEGKVSKFKRVRLEARERGVKALQVRDKPEDLHTAMYLELHPKLTGGAYQDKTMAAMFSRIDEKAYSMEQRTKRSQRIAAVNVAEAMSEAEISQFALAHQWDLSMDEGMLRDKIEALAEADPQHFSDLVKGKSLEYRATIQKALDASVIAYQSAELQYLWSGSGEVILKLSAASGKHPVEQMADWALTGGAKAEAVYNKIKSLLK
jgi:hypothetical protein